MILLSIARILCGLILGTSVLIIVYNGLKYCTIQCDPTPTEQAKKQIVYSGIGIFISLCSFTFLKLLYEINPGFISWFDKKENWMFMIEHLSVYFLVSSLSIWAYSFYMLKLSKGNRKSEIGTVKNTLYFGSIAFFVSLLGIGLGLSLHA